jgi:hypothetical protein
VLLLLVFGFVIFIDSGSVMFIFFGLFCDEFDDESDNE